MNGERKENSAVHFAEACDRIRNTGTILSDAYASSNSKFKTPAKSTMEVIDIVVVPESGVGAAGALSFGIVALGSS